MTDQDLLDRVYRAIITLQIRGDDHTIALLTDLQREIETLEGTVQGLLDGQIEVIDGITTIKGAAPEY